MAKDIFATKSFKNYPLPPDSIGFENGEIIIENQEVVSIFFAVGFIRRTRKSQKKPFCFYQNG